MLFLLWILNAVCNARGGKFTCQDTFSPGEIMPFNKQFANCYCTDKSIDCETIFHYLQGNGECTADTHCKDALAIRLKAVRYWPPIQRTDCYHWTFLQQFYYGEIQPN
eukprot:GHVR01077824.1.p2 GENE.GHVR01077824.1~~GHVR01077824.1.p2  ORF type:complete len:108 (+),score=3.57 GHVR01077824.1:135-458(+)